MAENFYCKRYSGAEFLADVFNEEFIWNVKNGMVDLATKNENTVCKEQCFDCMAVVGERQQRTRDLMEKNKNNE